MWEPRRLTIYGTSRPATGIVLLFFNKNMTGSRKKNITEGSSRNGSIFCLYTRSGDRLFRLGFSWISSVPPIKFWIIITNYATTVSFHSPFNSMFAMFANHRIVIWWLKAGIAEQVEVLIARQRSVNRFRGKINTHQRQYTQAIARKWPASHVTSPTNGRIYDVRRWDWLSCHAIYTKFHEDWLMHPNVDWGGCTDTHRG
jgi:hypothetical protein